jgi:intracellular septation protein
MKALFFGGLLPVIAFTLIEHFKGPVWGTIAGLIFGAGEVIYELKRDGKVSTITLSSNAMIFLLGMISIYTQEGFWFKLQPALLVLAFGIWLIVTHLRGDPLLLALAKKQRQDIPPPLMEFFGQLNLRLGFFFIAMAGLAGWAAFSWSTEAWAFLKGLGTPLLMAVYLLIEILIFRYRKGK